MKRDTGGPCGAFLATKRALGVGKPWRRVLAWMLVVTVAVAGCRTPESGPPVSAPPVSAPPVQTLAAEPTPIPPIRPTLRDLADRHGLLIGAAVTLDPLRRDPAYGQVLGREFNFLTTENALKFGPVHPARDRYAFEDADAIVTFAEEHGMQVRGHVLVWHEQVPVWIETAAANDTSDAAEWEAVLREHILTVVGRYRGRIQVWDVVNEAIDTGEPQHLRRTLWLEGLGEDYIDKAFRWAHEADPDALLFYNDYGAEDMGPKSDHVYELVSGMVERGVPIHGVGLQMHISLDTAPDTFAVMRNMQRLGALGLQVHITELDVRLPASAGAALLERQAMIYAGLLDVCLLADPCTAFTLWGFTDAHSWVPESLAGEGDALIFDAGYAPKPAYGELVRVLSTALLRLPRPEDYGAGCDCLP